MQSHINCPKYLCINSYQILYGISINKLNLQMKKLDEVNNLPRSHRLGKKMAVLGLKSETNFSLLKFTLCTTFPRLLTFGISFHNHKIINCV